MIKLRVTNQRQEGKQLRVMFDIIQDGVIIATHSSTFPSDRTLKEMRDSLLLEKQSYLDAESKSQEIQSLIGLEL